MRTRTGTTYVVNYIDGVPFYTFPQNPRRHTK